MKKTIQVKIEYPETNSLDRKCKWICPELTAIDGIGELALWELKGLVVTIGFINDEQEKIIGSGVMIAPGVCLTATHVMEETRQKNALVYSFPCENSMRIWSPRDFSASEKVSVEIMPFQKKVPRYMDVGILSLSPFSKFEDHENYMFAPLEVSIPKIGERLWAAGYREIDNDGVPTLAFFCTSGIVTEQYLQGRGTFINGPCIEVAMETRGGMSGGPVYNAEGKVIGVISSSLEGAQGPSYISLIWPALLSTVYAPWPEKLWPKQTAGIQISADKGVKILGSARIDDEGSYKIKFPKQSSESMLAVLETAGIKLPEEDYDFQDFSHENFEKFLEEEGIKYLFVADKEIFDQGLIDKEYTEIIKLFQCFDASMLEGLEDLNIQSVKLLDNGNIGIDALYNIRIAFLRLRITREEYECHKDLISSLNSLQDQEIDEDYICYDHYARPFYRVNFTYNIQSGECQDIRFQSLSLKI
ncbi:S1 family peptidase [Mucilaginibacter gossypii]|uniref:S1 family peptidase n=1 Tax=Mucilaginibacter gossypii TaxID=551996 RepID=UPI0015A164CA|nr:serine protease [Mucilaginibacter gossypii]